MLPCIPSRFGQLAIALCLLLVVGRPAFPQSGTPPKASSGGLFGATRSDVSASNKLNFMFEVAESLDSDVPQNSAVALPPNAIAGGFSTVFEATSDYSHTTKQVRVAANASTSLRYYQDLDRLDALSHTVGLGASVKVPGGGDLNVNQAAAYSPSYLYQLFPVESSDAIGESVPTNPDYQIGGTESYVYNTTMALAFGRTAGTRVTMSGNFGRTDFQHQAAGYADLDTYGGGIQIAHRFSRSGGISLAYDRVDGDYATGGLTKEHRLKLGAEYSPALSRTRRASFRIELTPSQLNLPEQALAEIPLAPEITAEAEITPEPVIAPEPVDTKIFRMSGEVSASFPFRPNWQATARYRRSVEYLSVLGQPALSDAARLESTGLIARRVDVSVSAGYATVASVLNQQGQTLETYTGEVSLRYALKRSIALYSEYRYYYYDQRGKTEFVPGMPAVFEQHGVRVGVAMFIEALSR